jgi:putative transposase
MARVARSPLAGHTYHVIQRGNNRQPIFLSESDKAEMHALLLEAALRHEVAVHSYVLLDNHFHLLLTPRTAQGLPALMQQVGRTHVRRFNDRHQRSGTLFEGRFRSSLVQTQRYLLACMVYIDLNPVRARLCGQPQDYRWSSYAHYAGLRRDALISPHAEFFNLGNTPFDREHAYMQLVQAGLGSTQEAAITHSLLKGLGLGDAVYLENLANQHGLRLLPGQKGRPYLAESKVKNL